jgi:hypothetical protein
LLPPNNDSLSDWEDIECLSKNIENDQLHKARDIAIAEADSTVPTICFIESPLKFPEQPNREDDKVETPFQKNTKTTSRWEMEDVD